MHTKETNLMKFVNYIGELVPVATYVEPGVVTTNKLQVSVTRCVPGRSINGDSDLKNKATVVA